MGQKTHPYGFRLGIVKPWRSRWFANSRDFPKLLPFLVLITISVILFNLIADVMYGVLDPRVRIA